MTAVTDDRPFVAGFQLECSLIMNWARLMPIIYWKGVSPHFGEPMGLGPLGQELWSLRATEAASPKRCPHWTVRLVVPSTEDALFSSR